MPDEGNEKRPDTLRPPAVGGEDTVNPPTSRTTRRSSRDRNDPRGDGQGVFAELVRTTLDATTSMIPEPLPPDRQQRIEKVIEELGKTGPESDDPTRAQLLKFGAEALPALAKAFPGALWVDLSRPHRPLRSASQLSALAAALVAFGDDAVPYVERLLRDTRPEVRVSAALVASELLHGDLVRPLAARLQDEVPLVRQTAMVALRAGALLPETGLLRAQLLGTLEDPENKAQWRNKAAWTIGQLRDADAVPQLIEQLGDAQVSELVRQALVLLVGKDFGRFRFRWRRWWKSNRDSSRVHWLIEALDQSDAQQRTRVAAELVLLTGEDFPERADLAKRAKARQLAESYRAWFADKES